jgi:LacI family transcriptional regulator
LRVLAVADALGYVSNQAARALRGHRSGVVLLTSDPRTASIAAMAAGMEDAGRERGVTVSITAVGPDAQAHLAAMRILRDLRPLALVVTSASFVGTERESILDELEAVRREGANVVFIGEHDYGFPAVRFDDVHVGWTVADHMVSLGRRRPAILTSVGHPAVESRARGFLDRLTAAGHDPETIAVESSDVTREGGRAAAARLLRRRQKPDLILAGNDVLAIGAMHAIRDAGLRVPQDVALSGVDDIPIARDLTPSLTTVALPFLEAGHAALALALDDPRAPDVHLASTLVVRESSSAPAA